MIHVIPALTGPGGVSDYAAVLAERLSVSGPSERILLVGNSRVRSSTNSEISRSIPDANSFYNELELLNDHVLLHYANYGYAKRGCPFWLGKAISRWKSGSNTRKLITIFHEVKAFGPPWRSSFWLSPFQRNIARKILNLSDSAITSLRLYSDILISLNPEKRSLIRVLPVFSTVGEPESLPAWGDRLPRMILFGGKGARSRILKDSMRELRSACDALNVSEVLDIGPLIQKSADSGSLRIESLGELEAGEVSRLMSTARAGFFDYPTDFLSKSTIFAAYCAHGLLPVTGRPNTGSGGGPEENHHYWNLSGHPSVPSISDFEKLASNALNWYRQHNLQKHVEHHLGLLNLKKAFR